MEYNKTQTTKELLELIARTATPIYVSIREERDPCTDDMVDMARTAASEAVQLIDECAAMTLRSLINGEELEKELCQQTSATARGAALNAAEELLQSVDTGVSDAGTNGSSPGEAPKGSTPKTGG